MITLQLDSVNHEGNTRQFILCATELEMVLDMTNSLINGGHNFVMITLIENGKTMRLPLAAFDGQAFGETMCQLQNEWQLLLSQPIMNKPKQNSFLIKIMELRIDHNEQHIVFLESTIVRLELYKTHLLSNACEGSVFETIFSQNGLLIVKQHHFLANARKRKEKNVLKLELMRN